jgi:hypothetical protein
MVRRIRRVCQRCLKLRVGRLVASRETEGFVAHGRHKLRPPRSWVGEVSCRASLIWNTPDQGISEIRGEPKRFVSSLIMCWVALTRGANLALLRGESDRAAAWTEQRVDLAGRSGPAETAWVLNSRRQPPPSRDHRDGGASGVECRCWVGGVMRGGEVGDRCLALRGVVGELMLAALGLRLRLRREADVRLGFGLAMVLGGCR